MKWLEMDRATRLKAIDEIERELKAELDKFARSITEEIKRNGMPYHVEAEARLVVDDFSQDARLP